MSTYEPPKSFYVSPGIIIWRFWVMKVDTKCHRWQKSLKKSKKVDFEVFFWFFKFWYIPKKCSWDPLEAKIDFQRSREISKLFANNSPELGDTFWYPNRFQGSHRTISGQVLSLLTYMSACFWGYIGCWHICQQPQKCPERLLSIIWAPMNHQNHSTYPRGS